MSAERGFVIALLGAESTGKTTLASALAERLAADGHVAVVVPEYLREFCDRQQRTPRHDEQQGIAAEQTRRIEAAAQSHALVIAGDVSVEPHEVVSQTGSPRTFMASACSLSHVACGSAAPA